MRAYERLTRVPDGFLVIGDAVCGFNPIYGQGMTVAALQALALRDHLHQHAAPQPRRFLREIARVIDAPWEMATGADLALPGIEGHRTLRGRVAGAYIARLHAAAAHDAGLACAFVRVSGLVDRPETLLRPVIVVRVFRPGLDRRTHQGQISAASSTRWPSGSRT